MNSQSPTTIYQGMRKALLLPPSADDGRGWKDGDNASAERTYKNTKYRAVFHDKLVMQEMPDEVYRGFDLTKGNLQVNIVSGFDGILNHMKVFIKFNNENKPLGQWAIIELVWNPKELDNLVRSGFEVIRAYTDHCKPGIIKTLFDR